MKNNRNLMVAICVVFIVIFIIVPIPHSLLDVLLVINITLSLLILINAIFATDTLSMAAFPTMLLFTTLYRLSLNVIATRLIIGEGEAGTVIQSFGRFVGGNDLIVGFIHCDHKGSGTCRRGIGTVHARRNARKADGYRRGS